MEDLSCPFCGHTAFPQEMQKPISSGFVFYKGQYYIAEDIEDMIKHINTSTSIVDDLCDRYENSLKENSKIQNRLNFSVMTISFLLSLAVIRILMT